MGDTGRAWSPTTILINVAACLEKTDEQVLPALYSRVGASFGATPTQLGNITLARAFMQALASPLAGVAAHMIPRGTVIAIGCLVWSTFTALFAFTNSVSAALPLCAMNGVGLALVIPSVQSLTADLNPAESRGKAFGALWLTISFGGMLGALYATNMGAHEPLGIDGWRFAFWSVAILSALTGLLNARFVVDPTHKSSSTSHRSIRNGASLDADQSTAVGSSHSGRRNVTARISSSVSRGPSGQILGNEDPSLPRFNRSLVRSMAADVLSVLRIPTFALIIAQGIVGSIPYASLVFLTLYLQLLGMSDAAASALVALYLVGGGLGGLLGGWIGDEAAKRFPNHGRIAVTQFSVAAGIPCAVIIFKGLPLNGDVGTVGLYGLSILAFALLTAWPAPACNNPVFAEITPVRLRNLIYAFDRCFEGAMAAFATPFVGLLSERFFGFSGASTVSGDIAVDRANAIALGNALLFFLVVPWALCLVAYSFLHWTYPEDKRQATAAMTRSKSAEEIDEETSFNGDIELDVELEETRSFLDANVMKSRNNIDSFPSDEGSQDADASLRKGGRSTPTSHNTSLRRQGSLLQGKEEARAIHRKN